MDAASSNPYSPPLSAVADITEPAADLPDASRWRRLANYLIDLLTQYALAAGIALALAFGFDLADEIQNLSRWEEWIYGVILMVAYYTVAEGATGRTIGKLITGTRVVTLEGTPPGYKTAFLRSLARLIPLEFLSIFRDPPQAWHDRLPDTRVVLTRGVRVEP